MYIDLLIKWIHGENVVYFVMPWGYPEWDDNSTKPDARGEGIDFMFGDGDLSCDCNRSGFIRAYHDKKFPEMDCGEEIEFSWEILWDSLRKDEYLTHQYQESKELI